MLVGVAQTQRVPAASKIRLDKRPHVADACRRAEIQVDAAWKRNHVDAPAHRCVCHVHGNVGCDERVGYEQRIQCGHPIRPHESADLDRRVGAWNVERTREVSGRDNVGRKFRKLTLRLGLDRRRYHRRRRGAAKRGHECPRLVELLLQLVDPVSLLLDKPLLTLNKAGELHHCGLRGEIDLLPVNRWRHEQDQPERPEDGRMRCDPQAPRRHLWINR